MQRKTGQVRALKFNRLGDTRKLIRKANAIDLYKEWVLAVGSGKVKRIDRLAKVALANNRGIRGLFDLYNRAAHDVYHTKSYEDDMLRGLLLWRLGGAQVADIAHKSLGLPALHTLRRHTVLPRLVASPGQPTRQEIKANTIACLEPIAEIMSNSEYQVFHQVVMFDELKVEERPQWDDQTNYIQGICREHEHHTSLFYMSNQEVDLLLEQIQEEKVHLASNATVGAIGILSENHRLYSALPVLISGQCSRETGKKHAEIIQTTLNGSKKSKLRTVCISSDGESRRGEAFVHLTFKHKLSGESNIYNYLKDLKWMNFEVGDDDIMADKDYKHVFKWG